MKKDGRYEECIWGLWSSVEMRTGYDAKGRRYRVCECSGCKECEGCQFSHPNIAEKAFAIVTLRRPDRRGKGSGPKSI